MRERFHRIKSFFWINDNQSPFLVLLKISVNIKTYIDLTHNMFAVQGLFMYYFITQGLIMNANCNPQRAMLKCNVPELLSVPKHPCMVNL